MILRYFSSALLGLALAGPAQLLLPAQQPGDKPAQPPAVQPQNIPRSLPEAPAPRSPSPASPSPAPSGSSAASPATFSSSAGTPRFWSGTDPNARVTVLENTLFRVWTDQSLSSRHAREGAPLLFTLSEDVIVDGVLIIPRGAIVRGTVVESRQPGALSGSPLLILRLTALELAGRTYPLYTYEFEVTGASKTRPTESKLKDGAMVGAVVGLVMSGSANGGATAAGRLAGAGTGAALGAGIGAAVSMAIPGPVIDIPAEAEMDFLLASPISVVPVTPQEATRLSQGLHPGGPVLYVRGETP